MAEADNKFRVLVIGGDSLLGRHLVTTFERSGIAVDYTTRRQQNLSARCLYLDLLRPEHWPNLAPYNLVYICAAIARLADADRRQNEAWSSNVTAPAELTRQVVGHGGKAVFISSNQVFDGSRPHRDQNDEKCPISAYGKQKAAAEDAIMALGGETCILRLGKVLAPSSPPLSQWVSDLLADRPIYPFGDMKMAPVPIDLAAHTLLSLGTASCHGLYQLTGPTDISYRQAGYYMAQQLGRSAELVRPISAKDEGFDPSFLPDNTTLDCRRLRDDLGLVAPTPTSIIDNIINQNKINKNAASS